MNVRNLTLVLQFLFLACLAICQTSSSNNLQEVSFEMLIDHLENRFEVSFSYSPDLFADNYFSMPSGEVSLEEILAHLSSENDLEYQELDASTILIRPKMDHVEAESKDHLISVRLLDEASGTPLEYATAQIRGTSMGAYADSDGRVQLKMTSKADDAIVDLQLLGYERKALIVAEIPKDGVIKMKREAYGLEEVTVQDRQDVLKSDPQNASTELRNLQEVGFASGLAGNDILRQVQLLPGLSAHDDSSVGLKIRGDDEDQALIMLDGIPIYNAGHYYGIFSAINSSYVDHMSLYKNNLPIEYGGKTSGMLNLSSEGGSGINAFSANADINLLTSSLNLQIPVTPGSILLLSGRTSYSNVSNTNFFDLFGKNNQAGIIENTQNFNLISRDDILSSIPDFKFNDINAKFIWKSSDKHFFNLNFFNSNDVLSNILSNSFRTRTVRGIPVLNTELYKNNEDWSNVGFSFNGESHWNNGISLNSTLYYANYNNYESTTSSLTRSVGMEMLEFENVNDRKNDISDFGIRSTLSYKFGALEEKELKFGLDIQNHRTDLSVDEQTKRVLGIGREANEYNLFTSYGLKSATGFGMDLGVRASYYDGTGKTYISPRINLFNQIDDHFTVKTSFGRQYQFVRELSFESFRGRSINFWTLSGTDLPVSSSNNFMVGAKWKKDRFAIDIEGFYKEKFDVIEFALLTSAFSDSSVLPVNQGNQGGYIPYKGTGLAKGIDLLVNYTSPGYASWISYTLSKSTYSFNRILRGTPFPSPEDRRHQWKWVNEWKVGDFAINGNFIFSSGRPYTDISILDPNLNRDELRPEDRLSRLPDYSRLDLGASYSFDLGQFEAVVGVSIYNTLNRKNVKYLQYIFSVPSSTVDNQNRVISTVIGTETNLLPRTFNLSFSIKI